MLNAQTLSSNHRGFTLIEVLVGIVIFALGMLALAQLQGNLAKNSADANARTVASNIAEEFIEDARTFQQIISDGTNDAFNDIADGTSTVSRGGLDYTVVREVTNYFYTGGTPPFSTDAPPGVSVADFKLLELSVTWNTGQRMQVDATNSITTGAMGSGAIELREIISSITSPSGGKVSLSNPGSSLYAPPVDYNPGANPDIISIQLGANKFKESTTPLPDVIRSDELVETRFDVVTYSQDDAGATFLRREEFSAVSCECTLRAADSDGEGGLRPTIWSGTDYTEGEFVAKPWGEPSNNQQSDFCNICCRDHHDGGSGTEDQVGDPGRSRFNPFRPAGDYHTSDAFAGDHKHYNRDNNGNLTLADSDGDTYVEACRLIRKDGFFRVAQDLRQEGLNAFPANYLDESGEVDVYSDYVTDAVLDYEDGMPLTNYPVSPPSLLEAAAMPTPLVFPASTLATSSRMSQAGITEQQLRSRGIYIDYMSDDLRTMINCLETANGDGTACDAPNVTTALEVIPFYDVQLTWLSRWNENPSNNPIDVTNEAVKNNNLHSRGYAELGEGFRMSTINAAVHTGNLGLTGTDPIDTRYASQLEDKNMYVLAEAGSTPPPLSSIVVSGNITSSLGRVKAADVEIVATDAQCDRTNLGFKCTIEEGANNPRIEVNNYFWRGKVVVACSDELTVQGTEHSGDTPANNWTRFYLPFTSSTTANIVLRENNC